MATAVSDGTSLMGRALQQVRDLWSMTRFPESDVSAYAEEMMVEETRRGLMVLSALFLFMLAGAMVLHDAFGLSPPHMYTSLALASLAVHIHVSARSISELRALHMLGMTLLIISGTAFVLLAHQTGTLGVALFTCVALLFMAVPLVPWGLREATMVSGLVYGVFSVSILSVAHRFDHQMLWTLQAFMLGAGTLSLTLVGRTAAVRKADIERSFELERAHGEMERLSFQDSLTQCWNRRYLEAEYEGFCEAATKAGKPVHLAVIDIDHFKQLNDGHGHACGDAVLQWIGRAFATYLGDSGFLARTGGDEFVLLSDCDAPESLVVEAVASVRALAANDTQAVANAISLSVGLIELGPGTRVTLENAYLAADGALYRAKANRTGNLVHLAIANLPASAKERTP